MALFDLEGDKCGNNEKVLCILIVEMGVSS
jgi:hypothetical protein